MVHFRFQPAAVPPVGYAWFGAMHTRFDLVMVGSGEAAWEALSQPDSHFDLVLLEQQVGLQLLSREPALQKSLAWQGQTLVRMPLFVGFVPPKPGHTDWAQVYAHGLSAG